MEADVVLTAPLTVIEGGKLLSKCSAQPLAAPRPLSDNGKSAAL
jgi:hypothetical protein